jgi:golgi apparatus protein 1
MLIKFFSIISIKLLYEYKKNFTMNLKLDNNALEVCKNDLSQNVKLAECKSVDTENGHLTSCLIDNKDDVQEEMCKTFLTNVAALVFSDYHLINNFVQDCDSDIKRLECGRIEKDSSSQQAPTEQGKTLECLSLKFQDLENKCKKQIVRVTELQSDDFHLDRVLYFACREDRERFCERISSGNGRVYKCLMKQKFNELMSKECQKELTRRQKIIVEDYKSDKSLVIACKNDIIKSDCRKELRANVSDPIKMAGVILCLESAIRDGNTVEADCRSELIEHRKMLLSDYQLNPNVVKYCEKEINSNCKGLERNGKTFELSHEDNDQCQKDGDGRRV